MAIVQRPVTPTPQYSDLPPDAKVEASPEAASFSDVPPGAQIEHVPVQAQDSTAGQPSAISRFASSLMEQNPIKGIVSTARAIADPVGTWNADLAARRQIGQEASDEAKSGGILGGARGIAKRLESWAPIIGPLAHSIGAQGESGDVAGMYGTALGSALNVAGPEILAGGISVPKGIRAGLESAAESQYRGALKPPKSSGLAKTARVNRGVATGLEEGIPVSKSGAEQLRGLIDDLNQQASDVIATDPNRPISPGRAVSYTRDLEQRLGTQATPSADVEAVRAGRSDFLTADRPGGPIASPGRAARNLTAEEAQGIKQGTYRKLTSQAYERSNPNPASVQTQQALARGLKDDIAAEFPELSGINVRESGALDLEPMLLGRVSQVAKNQVIGIGAPILGAAVKGVTGSGALAGAVGFLKAIYTPAFQSRVAIMLHRASKGAIPLSAAKMRVAGYVNALGQAVDAAGDQPSAGPVGQ